MTMEKAVGGTGTSGGGLAPRAAVVFCRGESIDMELTGGPRIGCRHAD